MLNEKRIIEKIRAESFETFPAAIGRNFFFGCFLSDSISIQSFRRYIELETRQKEKKAAKAEIKI